MAKFNPFKMWGSYVGMLLLLGLRYSDVMPNWLYRLLFFYEPPLGNLINGGVVLGIFTTTITGFLLGWGIHSLIRKLMR